MPAAKPTRRRGKSAGTAMRRSAIAEARRSPLFDVVLGGNLARHVLRREDPGAAAAFLEGRHRRAVGAAERDDHDPDAGDGAEPADDGLAGHVTHVEEP